ncbi:MAG: RNA 2',3'-cyclic phosphodiesterase [Terriglobales bacterium]
MRLFVALDLDQATRDRVQHVIESFRTFAPDVRWILPESLHVTLKFIGAATLSQYEQIKSALANIRSARLNISLRGYGFFPNSQRANVFWIGIEPASELATLARAVDEALEPLGIARETNPFRPHLTLARAGARVAKRSSARRIAHLEHPAFLRLKEKLAATQLLEFGTMAAREFFLYESQLSSGGSRYTKIAQFPLH